jgi:CRP-like cAMP-binding protein
MVEIGAVRSIPLFQRLPAPRLRRLLRQAREERFEKGAVLFRQGERAAAIWVVLEGWVHLMRTPESQDGARAVLIFTITPEEALCGLSVIEDQPYSVDAVAGTACRAIRLPARALNDALAREPAFAHHVLRLCTRRIRHIARQYGAMAEPVSLRLIRAILRLQEQFGTTIPVTHRELAQMSWTTTETAIRMVRALKRQGALAGSRGKLIVSRARPLEALLEPDAAITGGSP